MKRFAAVFAFVFATAALAQGGFPGKPVTMVVGFEPGGGTDTVARIVAKTLADNLGQQVVVENRAGAAGNIAVDYVAKQPADGTTLLLPNVGAHAIAPHKRGAPPIQGFLGPQVDSFLATPVSSIAQIKAGKARPIATPGSRRAALLPTVPTVAESGYPGYEALNWYASLGPARLPKELVDRLNRELVKVLGTPEVTGLLDKQGVEPQPGPPQELAHYIERQYQPSGQLG